MLEEHQGHLTHSPGVLRDVISLLALAGAVALLHIATNGRYGFHRDELQLLSDARHMAWGFVAYPPLTPFVERIAMALFGLSMVGLRIFSVLAQAVIIVISGLMARDLGGGRLAQFAAAFSVALSPLPLFSGTEFQYTSFDFLWWVLTAWALLRLLTTGDARWWLAVGAFLGLGLETKYSIVFFIVGLVAGMLFSSARSQFRSGWFWAGVALALLIFLPNFVWLVQQNFVCYRFLQHIHMRDVGEGRADGFLVNQFLYGANLFSIPLWITGLIAFFRSRSYRMLGWMYLVPVAFFYLDKGRFYYVAPVYPMLIAMGAATAERWLLHLPTLGRRSLATIYFVGVASIGAFIIAQFVPLASSGPLRDFALRYNSDLREEFGWSQLVHTVAGIRDSLTPEQRAHLGITTANYGEYGAIDLLGPEYGLPAPIGTINSEWLRGYPSPPPTTLIVIGLTQDQANSIFTACRWAGHNGNTEGIRNEESVYHPDIFVCGPPRESWARLWKEHQNFG
jgi:hypothetical protein